ncbi:MAG TPA: DegT/DnrJ/EryC1/StrS family aminotransferase [Solirubrobacterales bacterium]|nr:DegT/DnrJ/EryC1/StrS family aminotransferase [Solirubrobacterales bacterium]
MSTATAPASNPVLPLAATEGTSVPFIRLDNAFPELFAELMETVERIAGRSAFTLGPELESFEAAFAEFCGTGYAAGVGSGTAALEIALRALGIGPGDEVIVPTYSFIATAEAVSTVGATPVIVDVDPETALITAEIVEAALTPRTRCVIPVHLFGRPVEMVPLLALCRARGIAVVEDACQAHGALYKGRPVGSFGDAGCFSFYPTKNLGGWGDGGALVTNDPDLDRKVRLLRSHGEAVRHTHELATGTHRLDTLQAAILEVKLRHLPDWNQRRRDAAEALRAGLAGTAVVPPAPAAADGDHVYHLFVVRSAERDALRDHLDARGVASAVHYPTPIHLQPAYAERGLRPGSLQVAERLARENCSLPIFPAITDEQIAEIVAAVQGFEAAAAS